MENITINKGVTRKESEENSMYYPLMKFMMAPNRNIKNWKEIQELGFVPSNIEEITLYRGLLDVEPEDIDLKTNRCTSWTRDINVARNWIINKGVLLECTFPISCIVFDTRFLIDVFVNYRYQKEIIIRPLEKIYPTKITKISK